VDPRADRHIRDAAQWWIRNRTKAPTAFIEELSSAFALIKELPNAGEPVLHTRITGLRRLLLGRVQYHLYYVLSDDGTTVEVLALWHASRGKGPRL
jgi:plasmid stabilization system protein ParE